MPTFKQGDKTYELPDETYELPYETRGTQRDIGNPRKLECEAKGGRWDEPSQTCVLPPKFDFSKGFLNQPKPTPPKPLPRGADALKLPKGQGTPIPGAGGIAAPSQPEFYRDEKGNITGVTLPDGRSFVGVGAENVNAILQKYNQVPSQVSAQGIKPVGTAQRQFEQQRQGLALGQQVGQFGQLDVSPTGLDFGEATITGLVGAIPKALSYGVTGALAGGRLGRTAGAIAAPITGGISAPSGALIGAVGGFISGITGAVISNFKQQRADTTTAQQRVLDEGKQNLQDWATLAGTDPANRALYVSNFNQQLALIDQAYRQMKLDTTRDIAKFETALPNLAEFEAFYSVNGERDFLIADMRVNLAKPIDQENVYRMAELAERLKQ